METTDEVSATTASIEAQARQLVREGDPLYVAAYQLGEQAAMRGAALVLEVLVRRAGGTLTIHNAELRAVEGSLVQYQDASQDAVVFRLQPPREGT